MIVAPRIHVKEVTSDFTLDSYLDLQRLVDTVSEAIREVVAPERIYILSLGSHAASSHVHWHLVPLPPGVPLEEQQYRALMHEDGTIKASDDEQRHDAQELCTRIATKYAVDT